jgi:stage III sporulation protein AF
MIEVFSEYIKSIAICIIFAAFIQMLLPNNNFRKYVDLVLGLIIILVVLNPIIHIFNKNNDVDFKVFSMDSAIKNASLVNQKDIYEASQKKIILETYKQQLNEQIENLIAQNVKLSIENITIEMDEDYESKSFASIKKVSVYGDTVNTNDTLKNSKEVIYVEKVEKIMVQPQTQQYKKEVTDRDYELEKKIETLISDFYKLDKDNIYIIVHRT